LTGLGLDVRIAKLGGCLIVLLLIAPGARNGEVGYPVTATPRFRDDMLNFQANSNLLAWKVLCPTVSALSTPLL
jgi:hypothetical protein